MKLPHSLQLPGMRERETCSDTNFCFLRNIDRSIDVRGVQLDALFFSCRKWDFCCLKHTTPEDVHKLFGVKHKQCHMRATLFHTQFMHFQEKSSQSKEKSLVKFLSP